MIFGGEFSDTLQGDAGNDTIDGQAGTDSIDGGVGDDLVNGGSGNDSLVGNDGNDTISGDMGNDTVDGGFADDLIFGGAGNDSLLGNIGNDTLQGQAGNDSLEGGGGADNLNGGTGADRVTSGFEDPLAVTPNNPVIISAADAVVVEGNVGTTSNLVFNLTLSRAVNMPVTVVVSTFDGTATGTANGGTDYQSVNRTVTFPANSTTPQQVMVTVNGDNNVEALENVRLVLSSPSLGARLQNQEAIGMITDDDQSTIGLAVLSTNGGQLFAVNANTAAATLVGATNPALTGAVDISASGGTNAIGLEVLGNNQNIFTINTGTGAISNVVAVGNANGFNTRGDVAFDGNRTLFAVFSTTNSNFNGANPNLFAIDVMSGQATDLGELVVGSTTLQPISGAITSVDFDYLAFGNGILYGVITGGLVGPNGNFNDALFTLTPVMVNNQSQVNATFIGGLGRPFGASLGGMEFDIASQQLYLLDGPTGDLYSISNLTAGTPNAGNVTRIGNTGRANSSGLATGAPPQPPPAPISVRVSNPALVTEGNMGTQTVTFDVTVDARAGAVTLNYQTVDGTATAGLDYVATGGTLVFPAGGGMQSVTVTVNGDTESETDETFFLQLVIATGGVAIADGSGVATINNDDQSTGPVSFAVGDTLSGDTGNDTLIGDAGNDVINGGADNDSILAGDGNDSVTGGAGSDTLDGQGGNDTLAGQGGADLLIGGDGEDVFQWNAARDGKDTMVGTSGADVLQVLATGSADTINVGALGEELLFTSGGNSALTAPTINRVDIFAGLGNDVINVGDLSGTRVVLVADQRRGRE
ncbi:MAG: Calx-beta domain-containing protein [Planctomycetaceae bacterium]